MEGVLAKKGMILDLFAKCIILWIVGKNGLIPISELWLGPIEVQNETMSYALASPPKRSHGAYRRSGYAPPVSHSTISLNDILEDAGKSSLAPNKLDLFSRGHSQKDIPIFAAGDVGLLVPPSVAIVGTRQVSDEGRRRARRLAAELAQAGVVVASGLAKGVDAAAHMGAIEASGSTIAVIGTPLDKAYPAENSSLQEQIWRNHLLLSPFAMGESVYKGNFPKRNRVMAAITDATVIIEASDTSGTLHQAAECLQLGRWLFIAQSVVNDKRLSWPSKFIGKPRVGILSSTADVLNAIKRP